MRHEPPCSPTEAALPAHVGNKGAKPVIVLHLFLFPEFLTALCWYVNRATPRNETPGRVFLINGLRIQSLLEQRENVAT